jgi:heme-degrading monooxygenase HmoA
MFARATRIDGSREGVDEAIRQFRDETLPAAGSQAGFGGGMLLADRSSGAVMAVTLWETEQNMGASEQFANQQRGQVAAAAGASGDPRVERYEVVVPF